MTVSTTATKAEYVGNGVTVAFGLSAYCQSADQVKVYANGVLVSTGAYSVSGVGSVLGVTVTFLTAPATGVAVLVKRVLPLTQGVDTANNETVFQGVFDDALDRGVMRDQQIQQNVDDGDETLQLQVDRAILVPEGEAGFELPPVAERTPGGVLIFDALGRIIAGVIAATSVAFGATGTALAATGTADDAATVIGSVKYFNVKTYGAVPGTVSAGQRTLNRAAIQAAYDAAVAATDADVKVVKFPGRFEYDGRIDNVGPNVATEGCGGVRDGLDYQGGATTAPGLYVTGNNCPTRRMRFDGVQYTTYVGRVSADWDDTIWPGALLRYGTNTAPIEDVEVTQCKFYGGVDGLAIWQPTRCTIEDVYCYKNYKNGAFTSSGAKYVNVHNFRAHEVGINEGYKLGYNATVGQTGDEAIFSQMTFVNCGKLDTDTAYHQEAFDLFVSDFVRIKVSIVSATGCGNGGLEFKTSKSTHTGAVDIFEQVTVSDVTVTIKDLADLGQPAITLNWNATDGSGFATPTPSATKARRFVFSNCHTYFASGATGTGGCMFQITAYADVIINDPVCRDADNFIRTSAEGSTDGLIKGLTIRGADVRALTYGVYHANGGIQDLRIEGGDYVCGDSCVIMSQGTNTRLVERLNIGAGARMRTTSSSVNDSCLSLRCVSDVMIEGGCSFEGEFRALDVATASGGAPASTGGTIRNSGFKVRSGDATNGGYALGFINEGTWDVYDNNFDVPDADARGYAVGGTGVVNAQNNCRGIVTAAPVAQGGALGDVFRYAGTAAGGDKEYVCTSAANNNAGWKGVAVAA